MKKKNILFWCFAVVIVFAGLLLWHHFLTERNSSLDGNAISSPSSFSDSYYLNRGKPVYDISFKEQNRTIDIYNVNFRSRNFLNYSGEIYGLLFLPHGANNLSAVVLMPGGGGTKEGERTLSLIISNLGYAVLTFDQRGIGETGGLYLDLNTDYNVFSQTGQSIQHLSVYDPLVAFDVLANIKEINGKSIAIAGESMGGRYAVIAAGVEKKLKGVIAISVSGFHVNDTTQVYSPYLLSIDPDNYIGKISPNKVFMLQGSNDSVVLPADARITFSNAKEPKEFFVAENCQHGWCPLMNDEIKSDLKEMFG